MILAQKTSDQIADRKKSYLSLVSSNTNNFYDNNFAIHQS